MRTLGCGPPTVLLHGILGSNRYWGSAFDRLGEGGRLLAADLLGFGASPRPLTGYGPEDHGGALLDALDALGVKEQVVVAGHSLGALVALWLAWKHPERVRGVVAFGPPLYRDRAHARRHLLALGGLERVFALDHPALNWAARKACENLCGKRPRLAARLYQKVRPELPHAVLEDATRHSWTSYSETLRRVIFDAEASAWLAQVSVPVLVLAGGTDRYLDLPLLHELAGRNPRVQMEIWEGEGHDLPLTQPERCLSRVESMQ